MTIPLRPVIAALPLATLTTACNSKVDNSQHVSGIRQVSQTKTRGTRFPMDRIPEMDARMTYTDDPYGIDAKHAQLRATDS